MLPNVICVGTQKGGSTWLHNRLKEHPDVFASNPKELQLFSRPKWFKRLEGYEEHFKDVTTEKVVMESTPGYFWSYSEQPYHNPDTKRNTDIAGALYQTLGPDVKILLSMRHPVDRAISAYFHHFRHGRITAEKDILSIADRYGIVDMGFYKRHLEYWESVIPAENMFICFFDEIVKTPHDVLQRLCTFLDLSPDADFQVDKRDNDGLKLVRDGDLLTVDDTSSNKSNKTFAKLRAAAREAGEDDKVTPVVSRAEAQSLYELYRDDIAYIVDRFAENSLDWLEYPSSKFKDK